MIETHELTKRYGKKLAVDHLTITVRPGQVTGFLGPNGAGKSTTMRLVLGLDHPTSGYALVNGKPYAAHRDPLHQVGALLEARAIHSARSARDHLRIMAASQGLPARRADEVLELTGLTAVARRKAGGFSLGMGQRLGLAVALLADPLTLILDEPVNGLDPEGVLWVRNLVRHEAGRGRTVFLSSHLMSEVALVADHLVVLGRGRLLVEKPMSEFIAESSEVATRIRSPQAAELADAIAGPTVQLRALGPGLFEARGCAAEDIGEIAAERGIVLHELTPLQVSLEEAYMKLTADEVEYTGHMDAQGIHGEPGGAADPVDVSGLPAPQAGERAGDFPEYPEGVR
ncbi:MAG: ATP-binding cassette domain-containing protein [Actinomycetia bacterium]|nr:ATP-binding cassette domain-containing protein [Actinomycetes bacterium]